jgi:hypothetical protein
MTREYSTLVGTSHRFGASEHRHRRELCFRVHFLGPVLRYWYFFTFLAEVLCRVELEKETGEKATRLATLSIFSPR